MSDYGSGETRSHYCFCRYDGCFYVTDDYEQEVNAEIDVVEHIKEVHGE